MELMLFVLIDSFLQQSFHRVIVRAALFVANAVRSRLLSNGVLPRRMNAITHVFTRLFLSPP